jgi:hypothetical protein
MVEHIPLLAAIALVRGALGIAAGVLLLVKAFGLDPRLYHPARVAEELIAFDSWAFCIGGGILLLTSAAFVIQGVGALMSCGWSRRLGLALAVIDLANLVLFPLSTALGLYGLVVYRHPDVRDWFERRSEAVGSGRIRGTA